MELKGYITNLGRYNEGVLMGEWVTFPVNENELKEVLKRIGIGERYKEYFFTDFDTPLSKYLGEFMSIQELNSLAEQLERWDETVLLAAIEWEGFEWVELDAPESYKLYKNVKNLKNLGKWYFDENISPYLETLPEWVKNDISYNLDYESYGADIDRFKDQGSLTEYGWIERV